ncbi:hypothetical protein C8Q78DRAFT_991804 [Trametes maxima]|nr:hypothetical protein C8Q78DRAFT_991804 [Trametes maxima]
MPYLADPIFLQEHAPPLRIPHPAPLTHLHTTHQARPWRERVALAPGYLQFSLLLRAPLAALPGAKVVFAQYLFAFAVAEAWRDDVVLGPWPNDIYAGMPGSGEQRKIGGILVNTSFGAGHVELVVGCGLNVLNPPPIASLAQLLPPGSERHPTMEGTLAAIMARFEGM